MRRDRAEESHAPLVVVEGVIPRLVILSELLHNVLEGRGLANLDRGAILPLEVEGLIARAQVHELEHGAQKNRCVRLVSDSVAANNGGVHVHVNYDLLPRLGVLGQELGEELEVLHGVQDVHLHQHRLPQGAGMDYGVLCEELAFVAIVTLTEGNEIARGDVSQVADAWTLSLSDVLAVQGQVVVEEEGSHLFLVRGRNGRDDLGMPVHLLVPIPRREARQRDEEVAGLLAHVEVPHQALVLVRLDAVEVYVEDCHRTSHAVRIEAVALDALFVHLNVSLDVLRAGQDGGRIDGDVHILARGREAAGAFAAGATIGPHLGGSLPEALV
mmetsp:Transcript_33940/g.87029  ORF Transcript_33940/g.87029 Transcript_33940/m.87029 type:complete len:328 (-) Transcript_33940:54-1037(-)